MKGSICLEIVDGWIKAADKKSSKKNLLMLKDFIWDDLEYTKQAKYMLEMTKFLKSLDQNEDVVIIRRFINL